MRGVRRGVKQTRALERESRESKLPDILNFEALILGIHLTAYTPYQEEKNEEQLRCRGEKQVDVMRVKFRNRKHPIGFNCGRFSPPRSSL